ncbi:MAG: Ni/Fe hydrogenase subunit alpha [Nitrospirae bacterium]|jgi:F420-non-reducing hydrogenase large subunit|nr:Ni/Fe hydrogenase subunit alpha [Nitrospirota bacterium]
MNRRITVDPVTRLEGHGKIEIFLDESGDVEKAYFQVPELRGFEVFCIGRPAEEMPRITPKICGVCPTAHHICSAKTLDDLFKIEPTPAARKIREIMYSAFMLEDHTLHFFFLGGPDFFVGPSAPAAERNILGVISKVGLEIAGKVIKLRKECRDIITLIGGRVIHPVCGLPGGVSKPLTENDRLRILEAANYGVEFAQFTLKIFEDIVLKNPDYVDLVIGDVYKHETYYMGLVDKNNKVNFYDGDIRVCNPDGKEFARFKPCDYLDYIEEHVEPWSYVKFPYLKKVGWKGFVDGMDSGIYRVAPLARLNVSDGMATPLAHAEFEKMYKTLGGKPLHHTLGFHWARLIEALYAAERMLELAKDKEITDPDVRNIPTADPEEGIGVVEAPRGTLFHHYKTDKNGILQEVNLIVATLNNSAAICMSVEKAARSLIKKGKVSDGLLNMVEMAFRAYDPCFACATHCLPGKPLFSINIRNFEGEIVKTLK